MFTNMHYKQHRTLVMLGKRFPRDWEHCAWWELRAEEKIGLWGDTGMRGET
jgi:hypothetical protein